MIKIEKFDALNHKQSGYLSFDGKRFYPTKNMIKYLKKIKAKPFDYYIDSASHSDRWQTLNAIEMAQHYLRIRDADLSIPIIINWNGNILDGYHRITKALAEGINKIKAYRIENLDDVESVDNKTRK